MYLRRLKIQNIRSIENFELRFSEQQAAGWHVILGSNGSGKSSIIRSLALAFTGHKEAAALRQNWNTWKRDGTTDASIHLQFQVDDCDIFEKRGRRAKDTVDVKLLFKEIETSIGGPRVEVVAGDGQQAGSRTIWGTNNGWFSTSFGPFRRFTGGDQAYDRLYYSNPRLAPHLSAFGEDVALSEALRWLRELRVKQLETGEEEGTLLDHLVDFLNVSELLPHGARIAEVRSEEVIVKDANDSQVVVEQLSDGYRSVLSMIFEILRQMTRSYGVSAVIGALDSDAGAVRLPGVVAIDEVDAHLHPSWQKEIGPWFTRCFPKVQFIVTTHSPIICRNAKTVWRLATPGSDEQSGLIEGVTLNRLIHGSILDAYGTEYFGRDIARSEESMKLMKELATLNRKALKNNLSSADTTRLKELQSMLPTSAATLG
ncbi:AAA family ATPase [Thalassobius sp. MITS945101]|uniref:AAA family ATPase n=1 Tax=Thalassobius sp. MITS945101 TaxID=3096994 RepID=UPI00399BA1F6